MQCEVRQRPAATERTHLPPMSRCRRMPAGELRPRHHRRADATCGNPFANALMRAVKTHHVTDAELHSRRATRGVDAHGFPHIERERFFAQHVFSGSGCGQSLRRVLIGRRGDIDRIERQLQQLLDGGDRWHLILALQGVARARSAVHHRDEPRIRRRQDALGNRAPPRDAAGANHAPAHGFHATPPSPGNLERSPLMVMPPSATMTEPLRYDASFDARKSATFAISSGVP